jgi:MFS family permease
MTAVGTRPAVLLGLGVAIAAYLLSFFHRVAPAAISGDLQVSFAIGGAQLGTLAATYFYVYTVMQIPTGVLADTLGPRRILFWGGLVAGVGAILFGLAPSFELAFVGRTLVGLGVSVTFIAMLKLLAIGFDERRFATLTGLCMLIGNLGSILAGAPLGLGDPGRRVAPGLRRGRPAVLRPRLRQSRLGDRNPGRKGRSCGLARGPRCRC